MELQALRYAAMVSTLTLKRAVKIYQKYLHAMGCNDDAERKLLDFLEWQEPRGDNFALDVRVILVSSDFSKELTTSVIWLNERELDIRCGSLIPYKFQDKILVDVQQIIPLPETENYQIKIREQSEERREARKSSKDYTRYRFFGEIYNKRKLALSIIQTWIKKNNPLDFQCLLKAFPQEISNC